MDLNQADEQSQSAQQSRSVVESNYGSEWSDEFDLRTYFDKIKPSAYVLMDKREEEAAIQAFTAIQDRVVRWVGLYRAIVKAYPRHRSVLSSANRCLDAIRTNDPESYLSWFRGPQKQFRGKSPETWFCDKGLEESALYLRFDGSALRSSSDPSDSRDSDSRITYSGPLFWKPGLDARDQVWLGLEDKIRLQVTRICFSFCLSPDEFSLARYYLLWCPVRYFYEQPHDALKGLEIFDVVYSELTMWIKIYRKIIVLGCRQTGVLQGLVECVVHLACNDWTGFTDWFRKPQAPVFDGKSPLEWLRVKGLNDLCDLLRPPNFSNPHDFKLDYN